MFDGASDDNHNPLYGSWLDVAIEVGALALVLLLIAAWV